MKTLSKIFVLLFGLHSIKQVNNVPYYIQSIEKKAEKLAESLPNANTRTINGKLTYTSNTPSLSKSEFTKYMYNTKRVICL